MEEQERTKRVVLVVDGDVDERSFTGMLLQRFGCSIVAAHSAEEAIEYLGAATPSAIVAEAGLTGSLLLSWTRQEPRCVAVPLILLALSPDPALEERCRQREFAACLRKPVDVEEFYRVVQEVIEKGPRRNLRIDTYLMANLEDGLPRPDGYITVLSEFGLFFRTLEPRPALSRLPLSFSIKDRSVQLEAVVLYVSSFNEGPYQGPGMGMKFVKISPEDRALIRAFILERVEADLPPRVRA